MGKLNNITTQNCKKIQGKRGQKIDFVLQKCDVCTRVDYPKAHDLRKLLEIITFDQLLQFRQNIDVRDVT